MYTSTSKTDHLFRIVIIPYKNQYCSHILKRFLCLIVEDLLILPKKLIFCYIVNCAIFIFVYKYKSSNDFETYIDFILIKKLIRNICSNELEYVVNIAQN